MAIFNIGFRGEIKKDATPDVYFNLSDTATSADEAGVAAITVYYSKNGGVATNLAAPTFAELDAVNMTGVYKLTLTAAMTDTLGELLIYISTASSYTVKLAYQVVANIASDIYARVGAPVAASISADVANVYSRIGAPVGVSISADIVTMDAVADAVKVVTDKLLFDASNFVKSSPQTNVTVLTAAQTFIDSLADALWGASDANIPFRTRG